MVTNVEILNAKIEKMGTYGVTIGEDIIVMIILANVEEAAKWSPEHRIALTAIRARYPYEHKHDDTSMRFVLEKLAVADESRDRRLAPVPVANAAAVSSAEEQLGELNSMLQEYGADDTDDGDANTVIEDGWITAGRGRSKGRKAGSRRRSPSDSRSPSTSRSRSPSPPRRSRRRERDRDRRRSQSRYSSRGKSRGRGRSRYDSDDDEPNNCKHCNAIEPPRNKCPLRNGDGSKSKCPWNPT